jgi:excisionase family DNA binding protein
MANGSSHRREPWSRPSAWLWPGLALTWLATLATFVHGVINLLLHWVATVFLALLVVFAARLVWRRSRTAAGPTIRAALPADAEAPRHPDTTGSVVTSELRVLTADEVASILRVDKNAVIKSIGAGEFPGNRIGKDWRVDSRALDHWLQGAYRDHS